MPEGEGLEQGGDGARAYADGIAVYLACGLSKGANLWSFISEDVVEVLEQHRIRQGAERQQLESAWEDNDLIFPSIGTYLQPRDLSRTFDMLLERAKVTQLGLHGLRHTCEHLIKEGVDVKTVSEHLGHANVAFTLRVY